MSRIRIVTDSSTYYASPMLMRRQNVTVLPLYVRIGDERLRVGIDIDHESVIERIKYDKVVPELEAPSVDEIYQTYAQLNQEVSQIVSIHMSAHLCPIVNSAVAASKMLLGRCDIMVIDSLTLSYGTALLVERALSIAATTNDLDFLVRELRRMIPRIYAVFFVESMQMLAHRRLMGEAQTILGTMLGVMPFVTIEEGKLTIMEKALNNNQAVDKLIEFASEFTEVDELAILHHSPNTTHQVRQLQDRLTGELGTSNFPSLTYDGSIAALLGADAIGIVIFESEYEDELN